MSTQSQACGVSEDIFGVRAKAQRPLAKVLGEANAQATGHSQRRQNPVGRRPTIEGSERIYPDLNTLRAALPGNIVCEQAYVDPATSRAELIVFRCATPEGKSYRPAHAVAGGSARSPSQTLASLPPRDHRGQRHRVCL